MNKLKKEHKLNSEITAREIRIPEEGVMTLSNALRLAESRGLDLVLINDKSSPVICKMMNYEKFMYEQKKKPVNKAPEMKEIKLGVNMSDNDVSYRVKHIQEFLNKGHRVKLSMRFKGRELQHIDKGQELMLKLVLDIEDYGSAEQVPKMEGKTLICFIKPKAKK